MTTTPAAEQPATPAVLRSQAEANRKHLFGLRNLSHNLNGALEAGQPLRQAEKDALAQIEFGLQRALEEAHNIEAGVKLLVPR